MMRFGNGSVAAEIAMAGAAVFGRGFDAQEQHSAAASDISGSFGLSIGLNLSHVRCLSVNFATNNSPQSNVDGAGQKFA